MEFRDDFPELGFESQSNLYQEVSDILIRGLKVVPFLKIISLIIVKLTCIQGRSQEETTTEANTRSVVRNQPYEIF